MTDLVPDPSGFHTPPSHYDPNTVAPASLASLSSDGVSYVTQDQMKALMKNFSETIDKHLTNSISTLRDEIKESRISKCEVVAAKATALEQIQDVREEVENLIKTTMSGIDKKSKEFTGTLGEMDKEVSTIRGHMKKINSEFLMMKQTIRDIFELDKKKGKRKAEPQAERSAEKEPADDPTRGKRARTDEKSGDNLDPKLKEIVVEK